SLNQKLIVSEHAASQEGSQAFLDAGKEYSVEELLKSVIIASANDSSVVLAEAIGGSEEGFVNLMNARAKELGLDNTIYANATGLPSEKTQYSCAEDVAKLLKEEIKHKIYFKFSNVWIDEIIHESGRRTELVNTNILIRKYQGVDIGKTGFTDEAGYCLTASCHKNNMRLISVVIGTKSTKDRFEITTNLLNYGFANFENKQILNKNDSVASVMVKGAKEKTMEVEYEKDFYSLTKKGDKSEYKTKVEMIDNLKAPIKKGDVVGKVFVVKDGVVIGEVNITSKTEVLKSSYKDSLKKILDNFSI
ncbi:MAG: D-alanyl-D-alanine carboxypeptidase family protein, partial [Christensenellales bacterium]